MKKQYTTLEYLLLGLVPYSTPNLKLAFFPNKFFAELEQISRSQKSSLQSTLSRAQRQGLVVRKNGTPVLTKAGFSRIKPYQAVRLQHSVSLMVIFDIPEEYANRRRKLRGFLKDREFQQVQKSVWLSPLDYRAELIDVIAELRLGQFVQIFESSRLFPSIN